MLRRSAVHAVGIPAVTFAVPVPAVVSLPIIDACGARLQERFPVRRVFCVGQNYASHAKEMGSARADPFFFTKPADAVVQSGSTIAYPPKTKSFHHEVELVVAIGRGGANIPVSEAASCVYGLAVGLDLTRRDLQAAAKEKGRPWDMAKGFDNSAPCGAIRALQAPGVLPASLESAAIELTINGSRKQHGKLGEMVWPIPDIVSFLSTFVALAPGDLIFTGTPEGVGPLVAGDTVVGSIDGVGTVTIAVAPAVSKL